jgi:hypothetical protein
MRQSSQQDEAERVVEKLVGWLRQEVLPLIESGSNWKVEINGSPGNIRTVIQKHQTVHGRSGENSQKC